MAVRKSMANMLMDGDEHSPPISSPLRRKSVLPQKSLESAFSENDDEAERMVRRRGSISSVPISNSTSSDKRRSLGLSLLVNMPSAQMAERVSQCIKLSAENKINLKNAFSLEMIDFMTYMIKKQDGSMSNLQVASTSLDVSTKIYGYRVDGVHMEIIKMLSGLDKQETENKNKDNDNEQTDAVTDEGSSQTKKQEKKKKKRNKQQILTTVQALRTNVETDKPSLITLETDTQSTDMLYQATLPNHANSRFYQHPYNDIIVDTVECKHIENKDVGCSIPMIEHFSDMHVCPPLAYFDFQSWNADDEPNQPDQNNESRFQFDLNASLPNDEPERASACYFDIEDDVEENIDRCVRTPDQVENIVDFREVLTTSVLRKSSEYSFVEKNLNMHWAGPSHWKVTNFNKFLSNSRVIGTCHQAQRKKRKDVELIYNDETADSAMSKFVQSQSVNLHAKTARIKWCEEALTLPSDEHYDINLAYKTYLHSTTLKPGTDNDTNATHLSDTGEHYNYENENDTSNYCPDRNDEEHQNIEENNIMDNGTASESDGTIASQLPFTGDNLVALPKLTNKSTIPYCLRAKKIDMKQLKTSIWKCLTPNEENNESIRSTMEAVKRNVDAKMSESKHFSKVYKSLPNELTKSNNEALSFPISFVSLLHLANEKTLKITSSSDFSDLIVQQD